FIWATRKPEFSVLRRRAKPRHALEVYRDDGDRKKHGTDPEGQARSGLRTGPPGGGGRERAAPRPRRVARRRRDTFPRGHAQPRAGGHEPGGTEPGGARRPARRTRGACTCARPRSRRKLRRRWAPQGGSAIL